MRLGFGPRTFAFWLWAALLLVRVPSLAQPAGADQGLYAYVGRVITGGGLPYRDAWDQKPPAIHYTYAALSLIWPHESMVAAADLIVAACIGLLLFVLARRLTDAPGAGELAAGVFLLFANPGFQRLGGVRVRAQCETFIALAVTAAVLMLHRSLTGRRLENGPVTSMSVGERGADNRARWWWSASAGVLLGIAFLYKYNAIVYGGLAVAAIILWRAHGPAPSSRQQPASNRIGRPAAAIAHDVVPIALGAAAPVIAAAVGFLAARAWDDVWQATVVYNLQYSGETYSGPLGFTAHLLTFPVKYARLDPLWLLGGAGCIVLVASSRSRPSLLVVPIWVALACCSIAVNGSRELPQYFVQAGPPLALAAGLAGAPAWRALRPVGRLVLACVVALAVSRVSAFAKAVDYGQHDLNFLTGRLPRDAYLERFGGRPEDKYSALAITKLAAYLRTRSTPDDRVLIFGFSPGAYVQAARQSASRFFWSRPLIVGFNEGKPGYGADGLLAELRVHAPKVVVLQRHDWQAEGTDSLTYFLGTPRLSRWLTADYETQGDLTDEYVVWTRREQAPAATR